MRTLTSRNGLPCDAIVSAIRDNHAALWLYTKCGIVAITDSELDQWWQHPTQTIQVRILNVFDGAVAPQAPGRLQPVVSKSPDGRLWFGNGAIVQMIDPDELQKHRLPPPVYVEEVRADRHDYAVERLVRLPARTRDIEIGYTALSFSVPEKIRFRYRLDGRDEEWQDAGTRRQAYYSDLPPGQYRFQVSASNGDGVWNDSGAMLALTIAPAFYQTSWFRGAAIVMTLLLLWALYQLRMRQVAHEFDVRLRERVNERTRIARDLHDTLLQSFHGLLFRFQAASNMLPDRPIEAKKQFENAIDHAAQALTEGRDAVQNLRSAAESEELADAITTLSRELATSDVNGGDTPPIVGVAVEGTPRALHPVLRDDVHRIVGEALRNAFHHAHPRHIEVEIRYEEKQLRVRVRDDGSGIDLKALDPSRKHFGLPGMRERATLIGGRLDVWSQAGIGTEVDLKVPGHAAYAASPRVRGRIWPFASRMEGRS
jgi:signal transduction histidine kinase